MLKKPISAFVLLLKFVVGNTTFQYCEINHLLAAPELTREQNAIFRVKGEKIHIF